MSGPEIKKQDILDACKGMLQKQMYVVQTFPTNGMGPVMENIETHLKFQIALEEKGIMFGAGPFRDDAEEKMGRRGYGHHPCRISFRG